MDKNRCPFCPFWATWRVCCQLSSRLPVSHPEQLCATCGHGDVTECSLHELTGKFTPRVSRGPFRDKLSPTTLQLAYTDRTGPALGWDLDFWEWGSTATLDAGACMLIPAVKTLIHPVHIVP